MTASNVRKNHSTQHSASLSEGTFALFFSCVYSVNDMYVVHVFLSCSSAAEHFPGVKKRSGSILVLNKSPQQSGVSLHRTKSLLQHSSNLQVAAISGAEPTITQSIVPNETGEVCFNPKQIRYSVIMKCLFCCDIRNRNYNPIIIFIVCTS